MVVLQPARLHNIDITRKTFLLSGKQHLLVPFHVNIQLKNPRKGVEAQRF